MATVQYRASRADLKSSRLRLRSCAEYLTATLPADRRVTLQPRSIEKVFPVRAAVPGTPPPWPAVGNAPTASCRMPYISGALFGIVKASLRTRTLAVELAGPILSQSG